MSFIEQQRKKSLSCRYLMSDKKGIEGEKEGRKRRK